MEEEVFGLDGTAVSLICGLSVLSVVLVIVTLGIIGFFIKVISQIVGQIYEDVLAPRTLVFFRPLKQGGS